MSNYNLLLHFPFIIFVLCLAIPDIFPQIVLSKECHEFCASRRPPGTTEKFETFCGENKAGIVPWCQGPCNGICPTALCPDGVNLQCPEAVSTPAPSSSGRPSPEPPALPPPAPHDSDIIPQKSPKNALLILFGILTALTVIIGIIVLCVYSTSRNRREHNVFPGQPNVLGDSISIFSVDQSTGGQSSMYLYT